MYNFEVPINCIYTTSLNILALWKDLSMIESDSNRVNAFKFKVILLVRTKFCNKTQIKVRYV